MCATAQYGQTLLEPTRGLSGVTWNVEDGGTTTGGIHVGPSAARAEMRLDVLGTFQLKGVTQPALLAQALPAKLRDARAAAFETPRGLVETPHARARTSPRRPSRRDAGGLPIVSKVVGIVASNADTGTFANSLVRFGVFGAKG